MFFLKKLMGHLCMPMSIIMILMLIGLVLVWTTRKQRTAKVILSLSVVLFVGMGYGFFSYTALRALENSYPPLSLATLQQSNAHTIVVLGGGHYRCSAASPVSQLSQETLVRLIEGLRLQKLLPGAQVILSGGNYDGAECDASLMRKVALELGVDPVGIVVEDESKDTKDEARIIKKMLGEERPILVTSAYHMPRAMALFEGQGMQPIAAPVGHMAQCPFFATVDSFFPSTKRISEAENVLHEVLGIISAGIMGQL